MSVFVIRNDDDCKLYNRTVFICYTRICKSLLVDYVKNLELLSGDRQEHFFKMDIDILAAPSEFKMDDWVILTVILKSESHKKLPTFGSFIKLFFEVFPHKTEVEYSAKNVIVFSGDLDGSQLSEEDTNCFKRLSEFQAQTQKNVKIVAEEFHAEECDPKKSVEKVVDLAQRYRIVGGHWLMFTRNAIIWEDLFNHFLDGAFMEGHWPPISRFNAKISPLDRIILSYGNEFTSASIKKELIDHYPHYHPDIEKSYEEDYAVNQVMKIIQKVYNPDICGSLSLSYKTDIMSACCIQRGNIIRPTEFVPHPRRAHEDWDE